MTNLIIGCGYLGLRVARRWLDQGKRVAALTRGRAEELRNLGIDPVVGDVLDPASLRALPPAATVLYAVGMDRSAGRSFREVYLDGLDHVLDVLPAPERFIYVSSTSVYGQTDGEEVDENSPTQPREANGTTILEAEKILRVRLPGAIILRFAGIYGPGRVIRRAAVEKGETFTGALDYWLNLIHVDDGAQSVLAAEERGRAGESYLVSDGHPVRRRDFYEFLAELLGAPTPRFEPSPDEGGHRRIGNRKMLEELGVELGYADFRAGLRASL